MTGLYLYGIARQPLRKRIKGVFGRPLRSVPVGRLHAIVEPAARAPRPSVPNLRAQLRAVAAIVASGADLLPARFGSFLPSPEELNRSLGGRESDFRRALTRARGCVQMTLRVTHVPAAPRPATDRTRTGTQYLRGRAETARARLAHPMLRAIRLAAKPHARAARLEWHDERHAVSVHHLVRRASVRAYREALAGTVAHHDANIVISGPWAPFAFVEVP